MGRLHIIYFLEDRAQEGFVKALVERVAGEVSIAPNGLWHDVRSARHGYRAISEFKEFTKDSAKVSPSAVDLVVVAVDGNCKGRSERTAQLRRHVKPGHPFTDKVIYAVPDPHIERWYMLDQVAVRDAVGLNRAPDLPAYKCRKGHYKGLLREAMRGSGVVSLLDGPNTVK